ncbi:MAG: methylaspartate ammonia-lyase [Clostridiales bacterium]|nr:methylaspartate ammonia-lyase [Clostridiales bacterium]
MKIKQVICASGRTGFYFDDQKAIKSGAAHDGMMYVGEPMTPGFTSIRQAGEAISVLLVLEDGQVAWGDCTAVQYSGAGGRDPLFLAEDFIPLIEGEVAQHLIGRDLDNFRNLTSEIDHMTINGKRLHTAIRYGLSQAILDAVAKAQKLNMCDVIAKEYDIKVSEVPLKIFTQSGDDRYNNADKMIMKAVDVLPHGLFNHVEEKLGSKGEKLLEYIKWLNARITEKAPYEGYKPVLHIDVYGTIGMVFGNDNYQDMADYLKTLVDAAKPYHLRIEGPMDSGSREQQMKDLSALTALVDKLGIDVELVADEWCNTLEDIIYFADNKAGHMIQIKTPDLGSLHNTIEAVLYCKDKGISAYQGGTCNETDRSTQVCVHCAMASQADQILAKPGMGVDEGFMICYNEMNRILALRKAGVGVHS